MAENVEVPDGMFPTLDAAQIAHLIPLGEERHLAAGEIIYDQGDAEHGVFVVLSGSVELVNVVNGEETVLMVHGVGKFTGEVNWVEFDLGKDAENVDHLISPEQRLQIAMARQ